MVEIDIDVLVSEYDRQNRIAKTADREAKILKEQISKLMDVQGVDNIETCTWSVKRVESTTARLMNKAGLQQKYGTSWIEENTVNGNPTVRFFFTKKETPDE